ALAGDSTITRCFAWPRAVPAVGGVASSPALVATSAGSTALVRRRVRVAVAEVLAVVFAISLLASNYVFVRPISLAMPQPIPLPAMRLPAELPAERTRFSSNVCLSWTAEHRLGEAPKADGTTWSLSAAGGSRLTTRRTV